MRNRLPGQDQARGLGPGPVAGVRPHLARERHRRPRPLLRSARGPAARRPPPVYRHALPGPPIDIRDAGRRGAARGGARGPSATTTLAAAFLGNGVERKCPARATPVLISDDVACGHLRAAAASSKTTYRKKAPTKSTRTFGMRALTRTWSGAAARERSVQPPTEAPRHSRGVAFIGASRPATNPHTATN